MEERQERAPLRVPRQRIRPGRPHPRGERDLGEERRPCGTDVGVGRNELLFRLPDVGTARQQVGRQVHQLARIVDSVYRELVGSTAYRSYSRRPSYGRNYYGWYAVSKPAEKRVWFGSWPWKRK